MKVLLTGATGFVGRCLCQRLLVEENTVVTPVRYPDLLENHELLHRIPITGLNDEMNWSDMLDGVDVIVYLASRVHVMNDTSEDPLEEFRKINLNATLNLARQSVIAGVKRFVFISSIKVNGESTLSNHPFTEKDIPATNDPYGISKLEAENALFKLAKETNMEVVCIRPPLVYGPGVKANFLSMMNWLHKGVPLPFGSIHNKRNLVALDNLVDFILVCMNHPAAANQVFLVSDGEYLSTTELLSRVSIALGKKPRLIPVNQNLLEFGLKLIGKKDLAQRLCSSLQVDISKAKNLLNWTPLMSVDEGLRKTTRHFLESQSK